MWVLIIYFNSDKTKRIIIYKKGNDVLLRREHLYIFTNEEYQYTNKLAVWEELNVGISFYDSLDTAIKENEVLLKEYTKINLNSIYIKDNME